MLIMKHDAFVQWTCALRAPVRPAWPRKKFTFETLEDRLLLTTDLGPDIWMHSPNDGPANEIGPSAHVYSPRIEVPSRPERTARLGTAREYAGCFPDDIAYGTDRGAVGHRRG